MKTQDQIVGFEHDWLAADELGQVAFFTTAGGSPAPEAALEGSPAENDLIEKKIYKLMIDCLQELSDPSFQQRVWLRGEGPEVSSFDEAVCGLFDDTNLDEMLKTDAASEAWGPDVARELSRLGALLDEVPPGLAVPALLSHPLWPDIRESAGRAAALLRLRPDP